VFSGAALRSGIRGHPADSTDARAELTAKSMDARMHSCSRRLPCVTYLAAVSKGDRHLRPPGQALVTDGWERGAWLSFGIGAAGSKGAHSTSVDTIRLGSDREPGRWRHGNSARPRIRSRVALVAVMLLAAALAAAVAVAVHYRDAVLHRSTSPLPRHGALAGHVTVFVAQSPLPPLGALAGQVTVFVAQSSPGRAEVVVSALIRGARPHATYELVGNDCASNGSDHTWASGVTDSRGSAELIGHPRTVSTNDAYFLVLASRFLGQKRPGPAVHGFFERAAPGLSPVSGGVAPCAPLYPS
jgi:hypothetical protein